MANPKYLLNRAGAEIDNILSNAESHINSTHAPSDAQPNQNAFNNVKVGSTTVSADSPTDTLTLVGSNITITPDATNDKITFTVANGTTSAKGVVKLINSTSSTSTTTAATPNSVKTAYDLANTAQATADSKVPNTRTINGKALSSDITLSASDVGAVKSGGVKGEDGSHNMALSWNGSSIIAGVDNNAAVKTLVDTNDKRLKDSGFWAPYQSTNFVTDGSAPFSVFIRKIGSLVFYEFDLTTKYALTSTEENAKLITYDILDSSYKPNMTIYKMINVVNGKPVWFKFDPSGDRILCFGDEIPVDTRLRGTLV